MLTQSKSLDLDEARSLAQELRARTHLLETYEDLKTHEIRQGRIFSNIATHLINHCNSSQNKPQHTDQNWNQSLNSLRSQLKMSIRNNLCRKWTNKNFPRALMVIKAVETEEASSESSNASSTLTNSTHSMESLSCSQSIVEMDEDDYSSS